MSSDPTSISVTEPRDLVALVPYRLGFEPRDSLVLVSLREPGSHVGLVLRVDLADVAVPGSPAPYELTRYLLEDGATRAVGVVYDTTPLRRLPVWLEVLEEALVEAGVDLVDCWQVDDERFRSLLCSAQGCCPREGWPVSDLQSATVSAQMVALGVSPARTRQERLPDLQPAPQAVRRRVAARVRRLCAAPTTGPGVAGRRVRGLQAWLRVLAEPDVAEEADLALALAGLADPVVRDAVVLTCTADGRDAALELALTGRAASGDDALDALFGHGAGPVPTPDRQHLAQVRDGLATLARHAQGRHRADALAVLAWAAWWEGDGAQGLDLSDLALDALPGHPLATLVRGALHAGTPPGWVRVERRSGLRAVPRPGRR